MGKRSTRATSAKPPPPKKRAQHVKTLLVEWEKADDDCKAAKPILEWAIHLENICGRAFLDLVETYVGLFFPESVVKSNIKKLKASGLVTMDGPLIQVRSDIEDCGDEAKLPAGDVETIEYIKSSMEDEPITVFDVLLDGKVHDVTTVANTAGLSMQDAAIHLRRFVDNGIAFHPGDSKTKIQLIEDVCFPFFGFPDSEFDTGELIDRAGDEYQAGTSAQGASTIGNTIFEGLSSIEGNLLVGISFSNSERGLVDDLGDIAQRTGHNDEASAEVMINHSISKSVDEGDKKEETSAACGDLNHKNDDGVDDDKEYEDKDDEDGGDGSEDENEVESSDEYETDDSDDSSWNGKD